MPEAPATAAGPTAQARLSSLITGFMASQAIHAATQLGLADMLRDGVPRGSGELAQATGTHPPSLRRLLRALAALGVLEEVATDRFALTPLGQPLRSDVPESLRGFARLFCGELHWRGWGALLHSLRSGETVADQVFGMPIYDYLARNAGEAAVFHDGQVALTRLVAAAVAEACDFSRHAVVADVAAATARCWRSCWRRIQGCAASCSTYRPAWWAPGRCWRRRAWRSAAASWRATSSTPCPRARMSTS